MRYGRTVGVGTSPQKLDVDAGVGPACSQVVGHDAGMAAGASSTVLPHETAPTYSISLMMLLVTLS